MCAGLSLRLRALRPRLASLALLGRAVEDRREPRAQRGGAEIEEAAVGVLAGGTSTCVETETPVRVRRWRRALR